LWHALEIVGWERLDGLGVLPREYLGAAPTARNAVA
jgi:hypothetical protein